MSAKPQSSNTLFHLEQPIIPRLSHVGLSLTARLRCLSNHFAPPYISLLQLGLAYSRLILMLSSIWTRYSYSSTPLTSSINLLEPFSYPFETLPVLVDLPSLRDHLHHHPDYGAHAGRLEVIRQCLSRRWN
jgi:hypothetical protein